MQGVTRLSALHSASEVEDNEEDGEILFHPRALNPLETGDDWTTLDELGDHFYTHPCGPAEVPREHHVTTSVKFDSDGNHDLSECACSAMEILGDLASHLLALFRLSFSFLI